MKNFIVILVTLLVAGLWIFPIILKDYPPFRALYVLAFILSLCWGNFLIDYIKYD